MHAIKVEIMRVITKVLFIVYQYLIALPVFACLTLFTAVTTIIFMHWRNCEWLHKTQQFWSRSFFWLLFMNVEVRGVENIRRGQSYVFVCNHQSMADVFAVYGWLPVIFKWIMKKELRKIPFVGSACAAAGHIYIDRSSKMAAARSLKEAEKQLHGGVCVVIFPEGTRTQTGEVGRFKRGAFSIASDLELPILPISLTGCYEVMPKGCWYAQRAKVIMHIGKEFDLKDYPEEDRQVAIEAIREEVIKNIH